MKINNLMLPEGSKDFYDPSFQNTLEAHLMHLRESETTYVTSVLVINTILYRRDLFGYLNKIKVPTYLHWLVMRVNSFFSPYDFTEGVSQLLIPSSKDVEILRQSWRTTAVITT